MQMRQGRRSGLLPASATEKAETGNPPSRRAIEEFIAHSTALAGPAEVMLSLSWDSAAGWRVGIGLGEKMLLMGPGRARKLAESCLKQVRKLSPADAARLDAPSVAELFQDIAALAAEARAKNRAHEMPDGALARMPAAGRA